MHLHYMQIESIERRTQLGKHVSYTEYAKSTCREKDRSARKRQLSQQRQDGRFGACSSPSSLAEINDSVQSAEQLWAESSGFLRRVVPHSVLLYNYDHVAC